MYHNYSLKDHSLAEISLSVLFWRFGFFPSFVLPSTKRLLSLITQNRNTPSCAALFKTKTKTKQRNLPFLHPHWREQSKEKLDFLRKDNITMILHISSYRGRSNGLESRIPMPCRRCSFSKESLETSDLGFLETQEIQVFSFVLIFPSNPGQLALRAGNEKEEGETADTVGCCSLRVEHINLHPELDGQEYVVEFDFLGKDSIRYYNKVPVEKRVSYCGLCSLAFFSFHSFIHSGSISFVLFVCSSLHWPLGKWFWKGRGVGGSLWYLFLVPLPH